MSANINVVSPLNTQLGDLSSESNNYFKCRMSHIDPNTNSSYNTWGNSCWNLLLR